MATTLNCLLPQTNLFDKFLSTSFAIRLYSLFATNVPPECHKWNYKPKQISARSARTIVSFSILKTATQPIIAKVSLLVLTSNYSP